MAVNASLSSLFGLNIVRPETEALLFSTAQLAGGIFLLTLKGGILEKLGSGALISSAISSGLYAYRADGKERKYEQIEYVKQTAYSLLSGALSAFLGTVAESKDKMTRVAILVCGSAVVNAITTVVSEGVEFRELRLQKALIKGTSGLVGSGCGVAGGVAVGVITNALIPPADDVRSEFFILKKIAESGVISFLNQFASAIFENYWAKPSEKKDLKKLSQEAFQSACLTTIISGFILYIEQRQKVQECDQIREQKEQTEKDLERANSEKEKSERALQHFKQKRDKFVQNLAEKEDALKIQMQGLKEKQLQLRNVQQQIKHDQLAINEAQKAATIAEKEFAIAQQACLEAQAKVEQQQLAILEAQKNAKNVEDQFLESHHRAKKADEAYNQYVAGLDSSIRFGLKHGIKAKINGLETKDPEQILNAYLRGEDPFSWKKPNSNANKHIQRDADSLRKKLQEEQDYALQIAQKMKELQSIVQQKQSELTSVYDLHQRSSGQAFAKEKIAQDIEIRQAELKINQNQLIDYQNEIHQKLQNIVHTQEDINVYANWTNRLNMRLQKEQERLQSTLTRESDLVHLIQKQQSSIFNTRRDNGPYLRPLSFPLAIENLKKALEPETIIFEGGFACSEYLEAMQQFNDDNASILQSPFFVANIVDGNRQALRQMCSLKFSNNLLAQDRVNNSQDQNQIKEEIYARIREAIYLDIASLFFNRGSHRDFTYSKFDHILVIEKKLSSLIERLQEIGDERRSDEAVSALLKDYISSLIQIMEECIGAKEEALRIITEPSMRALPQIPDYIYAGEDEWMQVRLPIENNLHFHLDTNWPLSAELNAYTNKVLCVLPQDVEDLQALYQCLVPTEEISKENYRKHVIRGVIFAAIQENCLLKNQSAVQQHTTL